MYEWDRWLRRTAMPVLVSIASILVSIASIVFIVDTIRNDDDDDRDEHLTLSEALSEGLSGDLLARLGIEDLLGRFGPMFAEPPGYILGVSVRQADAGLVIEDVIDGSPADDTGLRPGDTIRRVDGREVDTEAQLRAALEDVEPGAEYELDIRRADGDDDRVGVRRPEADVRTGDTARRLRERLVDLLEDGLGESLRERRPPAARPRIEVFPPRPAPDAASGAALNPAELDVAVERAVRELLTGADLDPALVDRLTQQVLARLDPLLQERVRALLEDAERPPTPANDDPPEDDRVDQGNRGGEDSDDRPPVAAHDNEGSDVDSDVYHGRVAAYSDTSITLTGSLGPETIDITPETEIIGQPAVGGLATVVASNDIASQVIARD